MLYQVVEVRFSEEDAAQLGIAEIARQRKLAAKERVAAMHRNSSYRSFNGPEPSHPDSKMVVLKEDCNFLAPPPQRVFTYQICDMGGTEFEELRRHVEPSRKFSKSLGWFHAEDMEELRALMRTRVELWLKQNQTKEGKDAAMLFQLIQTPPLNAQNANLAPQMPSPAPRMYILYLHTPSSLTH